MKNSIIYCIVFILFCLLSSRIKAQDNQNIRKNQAFVEGLGNNFYDINASEDIGWASVNYSRKVITNRSCFMFSFGIGILRQGGVTPPITLIDLPMGILCRGKYKRNGLWFGVFYTPSFGKIVYLDRSDHRQVHNSSFQISPNLTYQFQSKSEDFFIRLSLTPKILASAFTPTDKYGYGVKIFPFWGGISIGGAW